MTKLSVNINKVALLRNSRKGNFPDLFQFAKDCEEFGAQGITVHPRPDQRHIRYADIPKLKELVSTEFNIEGYPSKEFINLVVKNKPHQCTLVPDSPEVLTSSEGWNTIAHHDFLSEVIKKLQDHDIRVSLFLDPVNEYVEGAKSVGADRIEFYTGDYAKTYAKNIDKEINKHISAARIANSLNLGINAGHDLNLSNLGSYKTRIPNLLEVSIGHALIADALYYGIHNTIQMYLRLLE